jgi:hypothetical protein
MLDFNALKNSIFYKVGSIQYEISKSVPIVNEIAAYDIARTGDISMMNIPRYSRSGYSIKPHLSRLIGPDAPTEFNVLLLDQWKEITERVVDIERESFLGTMIIQPPGTKIYKHRHAINTRQILTYCYRFSQDRIDSQVKSHLTVDKHDTVVDFPDEDKVVFTFIGNDYHSAISNEWRIYWSYDFDKRFEITSNMTEGFVHMNLSKIS